MRIVRSLILVLPLVVGCASQVEEDEEVGAASSALCTVGYKDAKPARGSLVGAWNALAPDYPTTLNLRADGTFEYVEYIAPCPVGVICVWDGIRRTYGTYAVRQATVSFSEVVPPLTHQKSCTGGAPRLLDERTGDVFQK